MRSGGTGAAGGVVGGLPVGCNDRWGEGRRRYHAGRRVQRTETDGLLFRNQRLVHQRLYPLHWSRGKPRVPLCQHHVGDTHRCRLGRCRLGRCRLGRRRRIEYAERRQRPTKQRVRVVRRRNVRSNLFAEVHREHVVPSVTAVGHGLGHRQFDLPYGATGHVPVNRRLVSRCCLLFGYNAHLEAVARFDGRGGGYDQPVHRNRPRNAQEHASLIRRTRAQQVPHRPLRVLQPMVRALLCDFHDALARLLTHHKGGAVHQRLVEGLGLLGGRLDGPSDKSF